MFSWYQNSFIWIWGQNFEIFEFWSHIFEFWRFIFELWHHVFEFWHHIFEFWRPKLKIQSFLWVWGGGEWVPQDLGGLGIYVWKKYSAHPLVWNKRMGFTKVYLMREMLDSVTKLRWLPSSRNLQAVALQVVLRIKKFVLTASCFRYKRPSGGYSKIKNKTFGQRLFCKKNWLPTYQWKRMVWKLRNVARPERWEVVT